jgi:hypothetical protein
MVEGDLAFPHDRAYSKALLRAFYGLAGVLPSRPCPSIASIWRNNSPKPSASLRRPKG